MEPGSCKEAPSGGSSGLGEWLSCGQMVLRERFKRENEDLKDELELGLLDWPAMFVVSLETGLREERSKALGRAGLEGSLERLSLMVWGLLNR